MYPGLRNEVDTGQGREGDLFSGVQSGFYWSATTYESDPDAVWLVLLGFCYDLVDYQIKTRPHYVWPVRRG
jgi:hypothetical protein